MMNANNAIIDHRAEQTLGLLTMETTRTARIELIAMQR